MEIQAEWSLWQEWTGVVVTTSLRITNRLLSKLKSEVSHRDHKKIQQGVLNELLYYLYNT